MKGKWNPLCQSDANSRGGGNLSRMDVWVLVLGILGILVGVITVWYARRGDRRARRLEKAQEAQEAKEPLIHYVAGIERKDLLADPKVGAEIARRVKAGAKLGFQHANPSSIAKARQRGNEILITKDGAEIHFQHRNGVEELVLMTKR